MTAIAGALVCGRRVWRSAFQPVNYSDIGTIGEAQSGKNQQLIGGIAPHHLLVAEKDVEFIRSLADKSQRTKVIILLPNHHEAGGPHFVIPQADAEFWAQFHDIHAFNPDDGVIEAEEAVATWQTLLAQVQVNWEVHPLLVSLSSSRESIDELAETIKTLTSNDYNVIASVDFSHYRSRTQAEEFDTQTKTLIETNNLEKIWELGNDNVDSGKILYLVTKLANDGYWNLDFVWHGNSAEMTPTVDDGNTTSYFIINFYRKP